MQISEQTKVQALQQARAALVFTKKVAAPEYEGFRNLDYYLVKDRNPSVLRMLDDDPGLVGALTDWFLELADECGRASDPTKSSAAERLRFAEADLSSAWQMVGWRSPVGKLHLFCNTDHWNSFRTSGNVRSAYVVTHRDFPALERDLEITSPVRCALPGCGRRLARGEPTAPADPRDAFAGYRRWH
jgi:hypothetical protein